MLSSLSCLSYLDDTHEQTDRDVLQALASTATNEGEDDSNERSIPTQEEWQYAVSNTNLSSDDGSANVMDNSNMSDVFFMGYNPGLWDFATLDAFTVPGETSASLLFDSRNQSAAYESAHDHEQYITELYPSSFIRTEEEEPTTQCESFFSPYV